MNKKSKKQGSAAREEHWRTHVESWRASGLSVEGYARQAGVHHNSLRYWLRKFAQEQLPATSRPLVVPVPTGFVPGHIPAETLDASQGGAFRLHLKTYPLEIPANFIASSLTQLLDCLEQRQ